MKMIGLFSGIGGFEYAARTIWPDLEILQMVEIEPFCQKVLNKNFPGVPIHGDIKTFEAEKFRGSVDIITGGFPCQPFSTAGKRKGKEDDRHLWPEYLRVIRESKPNWIIGENVAGLESMELENILHDLEREGYQPEIFNIPASAVGAYHQRERLWIIANANGRRSFRNAGQDSKYKKDIQKWAPNCINKNIENTGVSLHLPPRDIRECNGISPELDKVRRNARIKALGNAIVPQVAMEIFRVIKEIEEK